MSRCERCQGNGEIITDWSAYLGNARSGDEGTASCPDCDGRGNDDDPEETPR